MPLVLAGATSGSTTIQATDAVTQTLTLPNATGTLAIYAAPQVTTYTSGSGTYTVPTGAKWLYVKMVGGGGGGGGGSTGGAVSNGGTGGTTTFGSSLLTCTGGVGGATSGFSTLSSGGTATLNSPSTGIAINGATSTPTLQPASYVPGGNGSSSSFGGAGGGGYISAGGSAATNSGSGGGGGGASSGTSVYGGGGGASGAYIEAYITSPSSTYSYAVGSSGTAGTAGTNGVNGGAGGSGVIIITAYFG